MGLFDALRNGLTRTREALGHAVAVAFDRPTLEPAQWEDLEAALLAADLGPALSQLLIDTVKRQAGRGENGIRDALRDALVARFPGTDASLLTAPTLGQ